MTNLKKNCVSKDNVTKKINDRNKLSDSIHISNHRKLHHPPPSVSITSTNNVELTPVQSINNIPKCTVSATACFRRSLGARDDQSPGASFSLCF